MGNEEIWGAGKWAYSQAEASVRNVFVERKLSGHAHKLGGDLIEYGAKGAVAGVAIISVSACAIALGTLMRRPFETPALDLAA